jgi:hydroxylamine reductase
LIINNILVWHVKCDKEIVTNKFFCRLTKNNGVQSRDFELQTSRKFFNFSYKNNRRYFMFCYQCEQTTRSATGDGCVTAKGVCGKDTTTADLQDLLVYAIKGIAQYAKRARALGKTDKEADGFILFGLFTTLTNVNFNAGYFVNLIQEAVKHRERVKALYEATAKAQGLTAETLTGAANFVPATTQADLLIQAKWGAIDKDRAAVGDDIVGLRSMMLYGLKGTAAYAHHAHALGYESEEVYEGMENALDFLSTEPKEADSLLNGCLEVGILT